ncbi:50S ribosomal protein L25/general stress protein Ctc [Aeromicrobium duanguangcaii]|uniref:Large ribosomal subunit protein bL25 n=1 Tax=Aeromicrobium duanguangcaii TaxID=2968086 RepID=A0ABY5KLB8_9ACTN|nr:50S ribosomal protein L25/general stress protein Ctc [Aeromicrobium duanguangcaii]MCD9153802.1 50S ribosomal protein L25/general stress protein Ctc [Aeromicrobium duanguangcaii]MCL3837526.1 50S ribosomal protein L25/general stress protein Ctc [Aeromicrobium duanguangcaii]UUI69113.1 50S ribosomal protein L25/general stress protein Ctc [Aeromicrobium duanguangcaii]
MAEIKLSAEQRTEFGKGAARRIRRENKVPAVLYGHGTDPVHVTLPGHETMLALKTANALLAVDLDSETHLAIPKDVQRDPLKGFIEHVDLLIVRRGEKVTVDIAINVVGDPEPGVLVVTENASVSLEVEATHIPTEIEVSVAGLAVGGQVLASDLDLPEGASLAVEDDYMILNLTHAPTAEQVDAELEGAEAEAGIERDESETPEPESVEG